MDRIKDSCPGQDKIVSVDKITQLCKVADLAFKSWEKLPPMPNKDADDEMFEKKNDKVHCTLMPRSTAEIGCDTYTMWKMEHLAQGGRVRDFKWKWWHDDNAKSNAGSDAVSQRKKKKKQA